MKLRRQIAYLLDEIRPFDESPLFRDKIHATGGLSSEPLYGDGVLTCQGMLVGHVEAAGRSILDDGHSQLPEPPNFGRLPNPYGTKKRPSELSTAPSSASLTSPWQATATTPPGSAKRTSQKYCAYGAPPTTQASIPRSKAGSTNTEAS